VLGRREVDCEHSCCIRGTPSKAIGLSRSAAQVGRCTYRATMSSFSRFDAMVEGDEVDASPLPQDLSEAARSFRGVNGG